MSEVDRVSNSGLYPALPLADRQRKEGSSQPQHRPASENAEPEVKSQQQSGPRPPRSLIDEYA